MTSPTRQVHLDFHTSELIPNVAAAFNGTEFAKTVKSAHINSMTVFARCHHGWLYYDSKNFKELVHPQLKNKNLLIEQIDALHQEGIKAPVYLTVQWDYQAATHHPEWLIRKRGGAHEGKDFTQAGFYQSLCVNTGYQDYLKAITKEVITLLGDKLDGLFFDIVNIRPCWCATCRKEMKEKGIDLTDEMAVQKFAYFSINRFRKNMKDFIRQFNSQCTIFYNAGHVGPALKAGRESFSHFELESLPSGDWGYLHFPVTARYARKLGKDCVGMTGKFHTAWGDFHSLKNQAALEFECFRMLSFGFSCSIGDQLEPYGRLNPATYRLIGNVYQQVAALEAWSQSAIPVTEVALVTPENKYTEHNMPQDIMGASQMLEELGIQFDIIDSEMSLTAYQVVILPDSLIVDDVFQATLDKFVAKGGKIIACGQGGLSQSQHYPKSFGVSYEGPQEIFPDFIVAAGPLAEGLDPENEYVIYQQGYQLKAQTANILLNANPPYFKREGEHFCSHLYTPSRKQDGYGVAFQNDQVIVFSHPLFTQYHQSAPLWCKILLKNALQRLLPQQLVKHDGPSTVTVSLLEQPEKKRFVLHVLSYIPVRKSATIDIIEEKTIVRDLNLTLHLPKEVIAVKDITSHTPLKFSKDGSLTLPECRGYAVIELAYR